VVGCQQYGPFYFQQYGFIDDDLSAEDPDSDTGYYFKGFIKQSVLFGEYIKGSTTIKRWNNSD
jgi:hypothetical protein